MKILLFAIVFFFFFFFFFFAALINNANEEDNNIDVQWMEIILIKVLTLNSINIPDTHDRSWYIFYRKSVCLFPNIFINFFLYTSHYHYSYNYKQQM